MINILSEIPFFPGHNGDNKSKNSLLMRWEHERNSLNYSRSTDLPVTCLIIDSYSEHSPVSRTLQSINDQTYPINLITIYYTSSQTLEIITKQEKSLVNCFTGEDYRREVPTNDNSWLVLLKSGDILSPSLAYCINAYSSPLDTILYWNVIDCKVTQNSFHLDALIDTAFADSHSPSSLKWSSFAVRGSHIKDVIDLVVSNNCPTDIINHNFYSVQKIPECLALNNTSLDESLSYPGSHNLSLLNFEYTLNFKLESINGVVVPVPTKVVDRISVIVMYRDRADITIACISSIISSVPNIDLEFILVDNQSTIETDTTIRKMIESLASKARFKIVSYDLGFNHSAQLLLGLKHASEDVVAIVNNDVIIKDSSVLTHCAKWAYALNVASVGVVHVDETGASHGGPFYRRQSVNNHAESLVEEYAKIPAYPVRTFGNSFAFMVCIKEILKKISLDPFLFPNGYNDVDYSIRAARLGYTHITLGYLSLIHYKGKSREKTDESTQKLILRSRYPDYYLQRTPSRRVQKNLNIKLYFDPISPDQ